jgi:hypothetical protein
MLGQHEGGHGGPPLRQGELGGMASREARSYGMDNWRERAGTEARPYGRGNWVS